MSKNVTVQPTLPKPDRSLPIQERDTYLLIATFASVLILMGILMAFMHRNCRHFLSRWRLWFIHLRHSNLTSVRRPASAVNISLDLGNPDNPIFSKEIHAPIHVSENRRKNYVKSSSEERRSRKDDDGGDSGISVISSTRDIYLSPNKCNTLSDNSKREKKYQALDATSLNSGVKVLLPECINENLANSTSENDMKLNISNGNVSLNLPSKSQSRDGPTPCDIITATKVNLTGVINPGKKLKETESTSSALTQSKRPRGKVKTDKYAYDNNSFVVDEGITRNIYSEHHLLYEFSQSQPCDKMSMNSAQFSYHDNENNRNQRKQVFTENKYGTRTKRNKHARHNGFVELVQYDNKYDLKNDIIPSFQNFEQLLKERRRRLSRETAIDESETTIQLGSETHRSFVTNITSSDSEFSYTSQHNRGQSERTTYTKNKNSKMGYARPKLTVEEILRRKTKDRQLPAIPKTQHTTDR